MASRITVEMRFAAAMVAVMLAIAGWYGLPIRLPDPNAARFIGIHYLLPLIGLVGCSWWIGRHSGAETRRDILLGLCCYGVVLLVHFHLKIWAPLINAHSWDATYWQVDQQLRPLVDGAFAARRLILPIVPYEANFYMVGFIILFYVSFCYHAVLSPRVFRQLMLATILMQGLGGIAYLLAPAVGPFLFEPGLNPLIAEAQHYMIGVRGQVVAGGSPWLADHQSAVMLAGLGAMPSLHVGTSFVFLRFAARHGRALLPVYVPIFGFITLNSIASRWHYLIDLPAGIALACLCMVLAQRWTRPRGEPAPTPLAPTLVPAGG